MDSHIVVLLTDIACRAGRIRRGDSPMVSRESYLAVQAGAAAGER